MKCVQVVGQGIPIRCTDDEAFRLVHIEKNARYCPKRVWKEYADKTGKDAALHASDRGERGRE